jgi:hypothetical protein
MNWHLVLQWFAWVIVAAVALWLFVEIMSDKAAREAAGVVICITAFVWACWYLFGA